MQAGRILFKTLHADDIPDYVIWDDTDIHVGRYTLIHLDDLDKHRALENDQTLFYTNLEIDILKNGIRNPISIKSIEEGVFPSFGYSRLWVAKKHKLMVPCRIEDYVERFS